MSGQTQLVLKEGMAFDVHVGEHICTFDADPEFGGKNYGPPPKPLLLSALGGCTGMDVVSILRKMKMPFDSFSVDVAGEMTQEHPKIYSKIRITYSFSGSSLDDGKIDKAINLSLDKYCGVAAMLRNSTEITYQVLKNPS